MLAKSALSYKKTDVITQKSVGNIPNRIMFAHQATQGDTGFNLASLVTPTSAMPGFVNPSAATLMSANLYFNQVNFNLYSSIRGSLVPYSDYTIGSNTQVNFPNYATTDGEWLWGTIEAQKPGLNFVDASMFVLTGTLPAGTTTFVCGAYPLNMYPTQQIGAVTVTVDGVKQYRNTGNATASPTADGNYQETGVSIVFNVPFAQNAVVDVVSTGLLVNNPSTSRDAAIQTLGGQMNQVIYDLALATGNSTTRYQAVANYPDLTAFGNIVLGMVTNPYKATSSVTAVVNDVIYADTVTGGAFGVTLPLNPSIGNTVQVVDYKSYFATAGVTFNPNGSPLNGTASNYLCNVASRTYVARYVDAVWGWSVLSF